MPVDAATPVTRAWQAGRGPLRPTQQQVRCRTQQDADRCIQRLPLRARPHEGVGTVQDDVGCLENEVLQSSSCMLSGHGCLLHWLQDVRVWRTAAALRRWRPAHGSRVWQPSLLLT